MATYPPPFVGTFTEGENVWKVEDKPEDPRKVGSKISAARRFLVSLNGHPALRVRAAQVVDDVFQVQSWVGPFAWYQDAPWMGSPYWYKVGDPAPESPPGTVPGGA